MISSNQVGWAVAPSGTAKGARDGFARPRWSGELNLVGLVVEGTREHPAQPFERAEITLLRRRKGFLDTVVARNEEGFAASMAVRRSAGDAIASLTMNSRNTGPSGALPSPMREKGVRPAPLS